MSTMDDLINKLRNPTYQGRPPFSNNEQGSISQRHGTGLVPGSIGLYSRIPNRPFLDRSIGSVNPPQVTTPAVRSDKPPGRIFSAFNPPQVTMPAVRSNKLRRPFLDRSIGSVNPPQVTMPTVRSNKLPGRIFSGGIGD